MATGNDGVLWFERPGLTEEQVRRALAAAHRSLAMARVDIEEAYAATWKPEAIEGTGERMTERDYELSDAWFSAAGAALDAAGCTYDASDPLPLFPAELGQARHDDSVADLVSGRVLEVIPPPDPGPHHRFPAPSPKL